MEIKMIFPFYYQFNMENIEIIEENGDKYWYLNDKLHRENGPAIEWVSGEKLWLLNGKLHRTDGPAIEFSGRKEYWLNGKELSEEEWQAKIFKVSFDDIFPLLLI